MACGDPKCTCNIIGKRYDDLSADERVYFICDYDLDLCSHCGLVTTQDDFATDDISGDSLGVCCVCMDCSDLETLPTDMLTIAVQGVSYYDMFYRRAGDGFPTDLDIFWEKRRDDMWTVETNQP